MAFRTWSETLGTVATAVTVMTALTAWVACPCPLCASRQSTAQFAERHEQQLYRRANTLVKSQEARNQGKHFEEWPAGDQNLHRHGRRVLQELVEAHSELAADASANVLVRFHTAPFEEYYGTPLNGK